MDPSTAAAVKGTIEAADKIPFTALMSRMLGPAADELAERWRDSVRIYRYGNQLKLLKKAEKMATDAGFTPKAVPIKLLFPLLEGASLEENEELHTLWAALLVNASNPGTPELVHPSFAGILKQLSPADAVELSEIFRYVSACLDRSGTDKPLRPNLCQCAMDLTPRYAFNATEGERNKHYVRVKNTGALEALGLVDRPLPSELSRHPDRHTARELFVLTTVGYEFMKACQAPLAKT